MKHVGLIYYSSNISDLIEQAVNLERDALTETATSMELRRVFLYFRENTLYNFETTEGCSFRGNESVTSDNLMSL